MNKDYFKHNIWGNEWKDLFDDYINSVNSFGGYRGAGQPSARQWQQAMEFWWNNFNPQMPGFVSPTAQRLMEQSKTFYFLGQHLTELLENFSGASKKSETFLQGLADQIENMKSVIEASQTIGHQSVSDVLDAWQVPGEAWHSLLRNLPGVDQDLTQALKTDDLDAFMDKYLNLPGVGYAREFQEKLQKNLFLLRQFLKSNEDYNDAMSKIGVQALDHLHERILKMSEEGEEISSLRQIYNIWVDCNEEAYANFVFSKEYSVLYGDLVNSLTAYKKQSNEIRDELMQASSLPTRTDLEAMQKQTASLVKKLNKAISKSRNDALRIEELEAQLVEIKNNSGTDSQTIKRKPVAISRKKSGKKSTRKRTSAKKKKAETKVVNFTSMKDKGAKKEKQAGKDVADTGKKTIEIKF